MRLTKSGKRVDEWVTEVTGGQERGGGDILVTPGEPVSHVLERNRPFHASSLIIGYIRTRGCPYPAAHMSRCIILSERYFLPSPPPVSYGLETQA